MFANNVILRIYNLRGLSFDVLRNGETAYRKTQVVYAGVT